MSWTLADIRKKVRKVTGRLSTSQLTNQELDEYINNYYRFTFPEEVKLDRNYSYWDFFTEPNVEFYDLPDDFTNLENSVWVNGFPMKLFRSPQLYFWAYPQAFYRITLGVGDGTTTLFTLTAQNYPIVKGSVFISDGTQTFSDDGEGNIKDGVTTIGSVNYLTGQISITFPVAPANGDNVVATYLPYQAGQPWVILNFNNQLQLYPIPDQVYLIKGVGYKVPPALSNANDTPLYEQWGPAIAYGAARDIFADQGELDRYAEITALYKEQIKYALRRTLENLVDQRAVPQN